MTKIVIRKEDSPFGGDVYRACWSDGVPVYIGKPTEDEFRQVLASYWPTALVERNDEAFRKTEGAK